MSFIAAVLLFHGGEVAAFWLLCALMEKNYKLKHVLQQDLPGLQGHEEKLEALGRMRLPKLFEHFDKNFVTVSLFSTDWIISVFMNFIPIELTHIYIDLFFIFVLSQNKLGFDDLREQLLLIYFIKRIITLILLVYGLKTSINV